MNRLIQESKPLVRRNIDAINDDKTILRNLSHRPTMELIKGIVALVLGSDMEPDDRVQVALSDLLDHLASLQLSIGLFSGGDNLVSPPDSAFTINDLCLTLELMETSGCPPVFLSLVRDPLLNIAKRSLPAMIRGGVHTPNHRWEVSSALIGLYRYLGDKNLKDRAEEWLAEGIDIQSDGLYSERSPNYAAYVTNPCLIALSRRMDRPEYLDMVDKNLQAEASLMRPDGMLETIQSRRQDQKETFDPEPFLSQARLLALVKGNSDVICLAHNLSNRHLADPTRHLAELLIDPRLAKPLPDKTGRVDRSDQTRVRQYEETRMARVLLSGDSWADSQASATVYAGSDFPATGRVASGLANNPTILDFATRLLSVNTLRLSPDFFGLGPLRPQNLEGQDDGSWTMQDLRTSGYYQPLGPKYRRKDGSYELTDEGRFFACMSFNHRQRDDMTLRSELSVLFRVDGFDLHVAFTGPVTTYALLLGLTGEELAVCSGAVDGGKGSWLVDESQKVEIKAGHGEEEVGLTLSFQGQEAEHPVPYDPGESFTFVGGSDHVEGTPLIFSGLTSSPLELSARFIPPQAKA